MKLRTYEENLKLAVNTNDVNILKELMSNPSSKVRRAVARNPHTPSDILDRLAFDPVLNVSYKATMNANCKVDRCLSDNNHPCVGCNISEDKMNCANCKNKLAC